MLVKTSMVAMLKTQREKMNLKKIGSMLLLVLTFSRLDFAYGDVDPDILHCQIAFNKHMNWCDNNIPAYDIPRRGECARQAVCQYSRCVASVRPDTEIPKVCGGQANAVSEDVNADGVSVDRDYPLSSVSADLHLVQLEILRAAPTK